MSSPRTQTQPLRFALRKICRPAADWIPALTLGFTLSLGVAALSSTVHAQSPSDERKFSRVLDDTLGDFEYDLKNGSVKGTENISVRNVTLSENMPRSFAANIEDLIDERLLRGTKSKVIQCIDCRARRTTLSGDKIFMTSPKTNPQELARVARTRGIDHFLDATLTYQTHSLVLSVRITNPVNSDVLWSRTYNSETSRAAMLRRGVDLDQNDSVTRKATEYPAILQYRLRVDYLSEPDIGGRSGCLGFAFQMVERYGGRKRELGFEFEYLRGGSTLLNGGADSTPSLYSGIDITMLILHAWNLIGSQEDFNLARASVNAGIGGTYASGFLGGLIRVGFEWREAKHFATSLLVGYRPASTAFLPNATGEKVSGVEVGAGISFLF